jgi:sugar transferase (PEP-CTERM/EpsH1 system associated)
LVLHIIHRLAIGGLENGVVNLINHMPSRRYRHAIVSLTGVTDFRERIERNIPIFALGKKQGQDFGTYARLLRILRILRPDIVHTRNLGTLEYQVAAAIGGFGRRIHGEHGRDVYDPDGLNFKYNLLRRAMRPLVHRYIAVSSELAAWLTNAVGVRPDRVSRICNGVNIERFQPAIGSQPRFGPKGFASSTNIVLGTVGRMEAVKDPLTLVRAFVQLVTTDGNARNQLRLVVIGDGTLRSEALRLVSAGGAETLSWFPGERDDIPEMLQGLDLFLLPSLREGISNTILEAMATGLPVIATNVGGNPELVEHGKTGMLVPPADPVAMAEAIQEYLRAPNKLAEHGQAGRNRVEAEFSIESMVNGYMTVYESVLKER